MENIKYSYTPTKEFTKKETIASEMYSITKGKKILFSVLCAYIIIQAIYIMISLQKVVTLQVVYLVLGILILLYTWLLPAFLIKKRIKATNTKDEVQIEITPTKITRIVGNKTAEITARNYRGYRNHQDLVIVYYANGYIPLPTDSLSAEEKENLQQILEYFHNPDYFKTPEEKAAENEPEFPPFVPPDDFVPEEEEETSNNVENEDA